jgi:CheY-like chemotaxis protein
LRPKVLVADDQEDVRVALDLLLRGEGFDVTTVDSPAAVLAALGERRYDAALVDLNYTRDTTSGAEGLDLLAPRAHLAPERAAAGDDRVGDARARGLGDEARAATSC